MAPTALLLVLLAIIGTYTMAYNLGSQSAALLRQATLLGPLSAKRSSTGGGAMPPTQSDNIQSWGAL